jgi:hypothetical protein
MWTHLAIVTTVGATLVTAGAGTAPASRNLGTADRGEGTAVRHSNLTAVTAVSRNDIWAVGVNLSHGGGSYTTRTEHWDGSRWTVVASPSPEGRLGENYLGGVAAISSDDVWAVGRTSGRHGLRPLALHWNGTRWIKTRPALPKGHRTAQFDDVAALPSGDVWAVGFFYTRGGELPLIERWKGDHWKIVRAPDLPATDAAELQAVTAISKDDVWATGFRNQGHSALPVAFHWDGSRWSRSPVPPGDEVIYLNAVAGTGPRDVWAVGATGGKIGNPLIDHWDGKVWTTIPCPQPGRPDSSQLVGVSARSPDNAWAVGWYVARQRLRALVLHWNGTRWRNVSPKGAKSPGVLNDVTTAFPTALWAVGNVHKVAVREHRHDGRWSRLVG